MKRKTQFARSLTIAVVLLGLFSASLAGCVPTPPPLPPVGMSLAAD